MCRIFLSPSSMCLPPYLWLYLSLSLSLSAASLLLSKYMRIWILSLTLLVNGIHIVYFDKYYQIPPFYFCCKFKSEPHNLPFFISWIICSLLNWWIKKRCLICVRLNIVTSLNIFLFPFFVQFSVVLLAFSCFQGSL